MNMFSMLMTGFTFGVDKQKGGKTMQSQLLLCLTLAWMQDTSGVSCYLLLVLSCSVAETVYKPAALLGDLLVAPIGTLSIQILFKNATGNKAGLSPWNIHSIGTRSWCTVCYIFPLQFGEKYQKKRKMWAIKSASHPRCNHELRTRSHHQRFQDLAANRKNNWTTNGCGLNLRSQASVWYEFGLLP